MGKSSYETCMEYYGESVCWPLKPGGALEEWTGWEGGGPQTGVVIHDEPDFVPEMFQPPDEPPDRTNSPGLPIGEPVILEPPVLLGPTPVARFSRDLPELPIGDPVILEPPSDPTPVARFSRDLPGQDEDLDLSLSAGGAGPGVALAIIALLVLGQ